MTGAVAAAVYALKQPEVGGLSGLLSKLDPATLNFLPNFSSLDAALAVFIIPVTIQWWSVWYPGAEPGGGSYIAQRMLAARTEKDALSGTLLFNVVHYAARPWPWIVVALCSLVVFPQLSDIRRALPHVDPRLIGHDMAYPAMLKFLPAGFIGLMVAGLLAAYVSTLITHLNWGTSYLVHDLYRRFLRPGRSEKHYVLVGRMVTAVLMILAASFTFVLESARQAFDLMLSVGAGTGLIYLLRWFWWRINGWSEIAAMASSFLAALGFFIARKMGLEMPAHISLILTVAITTVVWGATTFLTKPVERSKLHEFCRLVRPAGPGWKKVRAEAKVDDEPGYLSQALLGWITGCVFVYSALFGAGSFLYGKIATGCVWSVVFVVAGLFLRRIFRLLWAPSAGQRSPEVR